MIKKDYLGNYTELISSGSTPKGGSDNYLDQGEILFIRSQNVLMNKFSDHDALYIPLNIHEKMKRTWVKNRDVLLNITGASIGRTTVYIGEDDKANVNQHVCIIRLKDFKTIDPFYLSYFLSSTSFQRHIMKINAGATRQALNFSQIGKFKIPILPIQTQKKIVEILKNAEKLKKWRNESDELTDSLLNSLFFDLFGDPLSNEKFNTKKISHITSFVSYGFTRRMPHLNEGIPIITSKNVTKSKIDFNNIDYTDLKSFNELSPKDCPKKGDILYTKDGRIGEAALVENDNQFCISQAVAILRPIKSEINPLFFEKLLNHPIFKTYINRKAYGVALKHISITKLKNEKIICPPLDVQNEFVKIINEFETLKNYQSQSKNEIDNLYNTLMQKAFKGELVC